MSKKKILIAAGLVLAAGAAATLAAGGPGGRHGHWNDRMNAGMHDDMDGDSGRHSRHGMRGNHGGGMRGMLGGMFSRNISADEFDAKTRERFARLDKNSDGAIDVSEVEAAFTAARDDRRGRWGRSNRDNDRGHGGRMARRLDTDKDGKVSKAEVRAQAEKRFTRMDLNNDGKIDDADLPPMMRGKGILSGDSKAETGRGHGRRGGMRGMADMRAAAKDGVVTKEAYLAEVDKKFASRDRNNDGVIDQADRDLITKEMTDYRVKRFIHRFGTEADATGKITKEQFTAVAKERFAQMQARADDRRGRGGWRGRHGRDDDQDDADAPVSDSNQAPSAKPEPGTQKK